MEKLDKNSKPYTEGGYQEYFEAAESVNLAADDVVLYSQSVSRLRAVEAGLEYRYKEGFFAGEERGIAIGEERGRKEEKEKMILTMASIGLDMDKIAKVSDLSQAEVEAILKKGRSN